MSDPIPPLTVLPVVAAFFVGVDWLARRGGLYGATEAAWPTLTRLRRAATVEGDRPYRAVSPEGAQGVIAAGVPAVVSAPMLAVMAQSALWTFAFAMGFGDLSAAFAGRRGLAFTLTSLVWCGLRAAAGWMLAGSALTRHGRGFAVAAAVVGAMDAALAVFPVPCSDIRADDVSVARAGLLVAAVLTLGFALAQWHRRGTLPLDAVQGMN
jgi:hypothetical protein